MSGEKPPEQDGKKGDLLDGLPAAIAFLVLLGLFWFSIGIPEFLYSSPRDPYFILFLVFAILSCFLYFATLFYLLYRLSDTDNSPGLISAIAFLFAIPLFGMALMFVLWGGALS